MENVVESYKKGKNNDFGTKMHIVLPTFAFKVLRYEKNDEEGRKEIINRNKVRFFQVKNLVMLKENTIFAEKSKI